MPETLADPSVADLLVDLADHAIVEGLDGRDPSVPDASTLPPDLRRPAGSFVTLHVRGELNGCIGTIEATDPLHVAVARHAWSAAFADPRLPQLGWQDYEHLSIEISILSEMTPIASRSRNELLNRVRPGVDGLVISAGRRRALFLPTVWEQLPDPDTFLDRLAWKADIDLVNAWPSTVRAFTFQTETVRRRR